MINLYIAFMVIYTYIIFYYYTDIMSTPTTFAFYTPWHINWVTFGTGKICSGEVIP